MLELFIILCIIILSYDQIISLYIIFFVQQSAHWSLVFRSLKTVWGFKTNPSTAVFVRLERSQIGQADQWFKLRSWEVRSSVSRDNMCNCSL